MAKDRPTNRRNARIIQLMTKIVHTADWHLGARLVDFDRHDEQAAFLDWLLEQLKELQPDALIVAGDIFDGATPPQEALSLYYRFLARLSEAVRCRTIILGGNHDSPATLHAPRDILAASRPDQLADAIVEFDEVVVCAVPYLRQRDLLTAAPGESMQAVADAIRTALADYYRKLYTAARTIAGDRLIVCTGHLTAVGHQSSPSERPIQIGNLGAVESSCFEGFAYTALGHIHRPQAVGQNESIRYAGAPIPLSFAEVDMPKAIRVIEIAGSSISHRELSIPEFRPLLRLTADTQSLLGVLRAAEGPAGSRFFPWVELTLADGRAHPDLERQVREAAEGLNLRVLKLLTPELPDDPANPRSPVPAQQLNELTPEEVFGALLRAVGIDAAGVEGADLMTTLTVLLNRMQENTGAENRQDSVT